MTPKPIYIVDIIGDIVAKTNAVVLPSLQAYDPVITGINYQYDQPLKMQETMVQLTKVGAPKYPLFGLLLPIKEHHGIGVDDLSPLRIIIARWSNPTDKTNTRMDNNFKPVLYPIYLEFLNQLDLDKRILSRAADLIDHYKTDWPYWGGINPTEATNPFSDWVDIIEIENLNLRINTKNC